MRTWVDTDKICEDTRNIIKLLSTSDVNKFSDASEKIILLEECLDEEEYEWGLFSDAAFKLLKDLLRIRIKLRKTDPAHHLVPVLIQAVDGLKEQLRLNRKHANELIEVHVFSGHARNFFWLGCATAMMLVLAAIIYMA
ncbi:hypothetical protein J5259_005350 [Klebsiella oxytoca]|uniref:hypothetical protein n=1 Tax=Klebsiella sp. A-Nf5 TaxID=2054608 RepID=UPI000C29BFEE|nr:hypothetical protein [Klebsiella sp. A-Nf5]EHG8285156.1 hypothetical protein [Klebsiella oxytoca]PJX32685.1 hypothetical protein CWM53_08870 [Klebsiella sp. A-Nf5]